MIRRISAILIVSLLLVAFLAMTAFAARPSDQRKSSDKAHPGLMSSPKRAIGYSFPKEGLGGKAFDLTNKSGGKPIGVTSYSATEDSPGVVYGATWYDYQHNCSMGRMIETGPHSGGTGSAIVHMGWMHMPDGGANETFNRTYAYNAYDAGAGDFVAEIMLHPYPARSGYVNVDVTGDNRALVGGHHSIEFNNEWFQTHIHIDQSPGGKDFSTYVRVPDTVAAYEQSRGTGQEAIWPKFFLQFGTDSVLHVAAEISALSTLQAVMYFRNVNPEYVDATWSYPPYVVDSVQTISQDITGQRNGDRVCMMWFANLPYDNCDTCSVQSIYGGGLGQMDNDVYVQISDNQGINWAPRRNISQSVPGAAGLKAAYDGSILFDQAGKLHLIYNSIPWPADTCWEGETGCFVGSFYGDASRILHWSEDIQVLRTICDHTYEPSDSCGSYAWGATVAKMTLSECDNKLYAIFSQFNDMPNGIDNDCAQWIYTQHQYWGGANADIWVSVSEDGGLTWDAQRNLTNSYSPHCGPAPAAYECESDYWASMSRWGRQNQTGENWAGAHVQVPDGGNATDWYLDISYVNDADAGGGIQNEGSLMYNDMKWFRMPCVEPVPAPNLAPGFWYIADPCWEKPGIQFDSTLRMENIGNVDLEFTVEVVEDNGPAGWLTHTGLTGYIPSGYGNVITGAVHLNTGGIVDQAYLDAQSLPYCALYGRVIFDWDDQQPTWDPSFPDTIEIEFFVTDTLIRPDYDTVRTNCLTLAVSNFGDAGRAGFGGQNMDYSEFENVAVDCDTSIIATVYLYESGLLVTEDGGENWNSTFWGGGGEWLEDYGFRPMGGEQISHCCPNINAQVYESGVFTTADTTIGFERIWLAPKDDCNFVIQYTKMFSYDGEVHNDVLIGECADWDVPYDDDWDDPNYDDAAAPFNHGGIDPITTRNLAYCQGFEWGEDYDTIYPYNCGYWTEPAPPAEPEWVETMWNDHRWGGSAFIGTWIDGVVDRTDPYSLFCEDNRLDQSSGEGFIGSIMYDFMTSGSKWATDTIADLHVGMCYNPDVDLSATTTFEAVTIMATVHDGTLADLQDAIDRGRAWFLAEGGIDMFNDEGDGQIDACAMDCNVRGDIDGGGAVSSWDVIYFVDWLWRGGAGPPRPVEADCNNSCNTSSGDMLYLVDYMWKGGPPPVPCQ